ncbi:MAG: CocE/NonD family hydrolase, partial [Bacteroidota bacterium]
MRKIWILLCLLQALASFAQVDLDRYVPAHYEKQEVYIPMRDGTRLFTAIYTPKDASDQQRYPILMKRTCYSVKPYGPDQFATTRLGPSPTLIQDGYIFVHQDVRGRWMSEGTWTNMTPHQRDKSSGQTDESSDTYDTIAWLLRELKFHNGKVGQWGISYPGFYAAAALPGAHPALKAVSPQAPIADFYFDDFHHNGAYTLGYFRATPVFGIQKTAPVDTAWYTLFDKPTDDGYRFFQELGPLKNGDRYMSEDNFFWRQLKEHPNYDSFWQERNLLPHLNDIQPAVMVVGGWFDAEDLYGPLNIYQTIEQNSQNYNTLVMGPFGHGGWAREKGHHLHHQIYFGDSIATFYQRNVEARFFDHFLKGPANGETGLPEAYLYDTGQKAWREFEAWPPPSAREHDFYLHPGGKLSPQAPGEEKAFS